MAFSFLDQYYHYYHYHLEPELVMRLTGLLMHHKILPKYLTFHFCIVKKQICSIDIVILVFLIRLSNTTIVMFKFILPSP